MNNVLAKVQLVLNQVIDESAEKNNVCAGANRHPDIGQRARARETRIDMDDRGAAAPSLSSPSENRPGALRPSRNLRLECNLR